MENNIITLRDEFGNQVEGKVLNIIEIDDIEYLLYSVSANNEEDAIYVKKIIKNAVGEEDLVDISDLSEKSKVFDIVREYINSIEL